MLVLARRVGEKIVIGDNIVIEVSKIDHNSIKLSFDAPADVPIWRKEISDRRKVEEKRELSKLKIA